MIQCHHQHYHNLLSLMVSACDGAVFHSSSVRVSLLVRIYLVGDNWSQVYLLLLCMHVDVVLRALQFLICLPRGFHFSKIMKKLLTPIQSG